MKTNNNTRKMVPVAILLLGLLLFFQVPAGRADATDFGVFFSGNVFGELEACGG